MFIVGFAILMGFPTKTARSARLPRVWTSALSEIRSGQMLCIENPPSLVIRHTGQTQFDGWPLRALTCEYRMNSRAWTDCLAPATPLRNATSSTAGLLPDISAPAVNLCPAQAHGGTLSLLGRSSWQITPLKWVFSISEADCRAQSVARAGFGCGGGDARHPMGGVVGPP